MLVCAGASNGSSQQSNDSQGWPLFGRRLKRCKCHNSTGVIWSSVAWGHTRPKGPKGNILGIIWSSMVKIEFGGLSECTRCFMEVKIICCK